VKKVARVAVLLPVDKSYDYLVPDALLGEVTPGVRVWAPWGKRAVEGVVVELDPTDPPAELRRIDRLVEAAPLPPDLLALARWVADFYVAPLGEVLRLCLPPGGRAKLKRNLVATERGLAAAAALRAALASADAAADIEALRPRDRRALAALTDGKPPPIDSAETRALIAHGLAIIEEEVKVRGRRDEVLLRAARPLQDNELARAPKRLEAYQRIAAAMDGITLDALRAADPAAASSVAALVKAGLVERIQRARRDGVTHAHDTLPTLTTAQQAALDACTAALGGSAQTPFLLHGITGSGKTEVYLRLVAAALEAGRTALVLVPEISLTPQLAARFRARFGDRVAVLHSGLGNAERAAAHRRIAAGEAAVALGARSAVFAPLPRLGAVVIDEEHDPSFKQQEGVRYHARDVALRRARVAGAVAVLGSATPSLEAWSAAVAGRLTLLPLTERPNRQPLHTVGGEVAKPQ
jgi:primosomal protein N' (replication factor Y)